MLEIKIDRNYTEELSLLDAKMAKKKISFFFSNVLINGFSFDLEDDGIVISYEIDGFPMLKNYSYKEIKRCKVLKNGYLIWFKDEKYIFIPVGKSENYNEELILIGELLHSECGDLRFYTGSRLKVPAK